MWVKICGTTNLEDAQLAAEAGADAVGFVFAPGSPRRVSAEDLAAMPLVSLGEVRRVGVFITRGFEQIACDARAARLTGVQLHGELDFALIERLRQGFGDELMVIQTLHWDVSSPVEETERAMRRELRAVARHGGVDAVLLDTQTKSASGGTGTRFAWARAREVLSDASDGLRVIVAGGLTAENVAEAIQTLRPWGVDVASGVEAAPGRKDPAKVAAFVREARAAFADFEPRF